MRLHHWWIPCLGQMAAKDELWGLCHCRTGFLMYQRSYAHLHMFPVARGIGDLFITLLFDFLNPSFLRRRYSL